MSEGPEPGWYQDPDGSGMRYWDGDRWTEHRKAQDQVQPPSTQSRAREIPSDLWLLAAAVAAIAVGSIGPWVTNALISRGGLDAGDGWITLVLAAFGAWTVIQAYQADPIRTSSWAPVIAGILAAGVGIYDAVSIEDQGNTRLLGQDVDVANPGWGLYLVIAGGVAMAIVGFRFRQGGLRSTETNSP